VQVRNDPYSAAVNTYTDERLRTSNFAATSREQVTVDENPATLLLLRGPQGTQWKLIFGDQRRSFEVTGNLADPEADREEVRDALLTARVRD